MKIIAFEVPLTNITKVVNHLMATYEKRLEAGDFNYCLMRTRKGDLYIKLYKEDTFLILPVQVAGYRFNPGYITSLVEAFVKTLN